MQATSGVNGAASSVTLALAASLAGASNNQDYSSTVIIGILFGYSRGIKGLIKIYLKPLPYKNLS